METPPYLHDMEHRLRALERQNRSLKMWIALAMTFALGAGLLAVYPLIDARGEHAWVRGSGGGKGPGARRSSRKARSPAVYSPTAIGETIGPGPAEQAVEINDPFGTQKPDRERINEIIRQEQQTLLTCVSEETRRNSAFTGRFNVEFAITPSGRVSEVSLSGAEGASRELLSCARKTLARWRFPRFSGNPLSVSVPLIVSR